MKFSQSVRDFYAFVTHTNWVKVYSFLFVILLAVGYGIGFATTSEEAKKAADEDLQRRTVIFQEWQMELSARLTRAQSLATAVANFGASHATEPMNASAPASERMKTFLPSAFDAFCKDLIPQLPDLAIVLLPGGVASMACPPGSVPIGFDMLNTPSYKGTYQMLFDEGVEMITGPVPMSVRGGAIVSYAWSPVFVNGSTQPRSKETFWGAGHAVIDFARMFTAMNVSTLVTDHDLDYVVWYTETNGTDIVFLHSALSREAMLAAKASPMTIELPCSERGKHLYFAVHPRDGPVPSTIATHTIVLIVLAVPIAAALTAAVAIALSFCFFLFRHRYAPTDSASIFIAAITLRGAQPVLDRAPLEAVRIFSEFMGEVRRRAAAHGCYLVGEIGDRTVFLVSGDPLAVASLSRECVLEISINPQTVMLSLGGDNNNNNALGGDGAAMNIHDAATTTEGGRTSTSLGISGGGGGVVGQTRSHARRAIPAAGDMIMNDSARSVTNDVFGASQNTGATTSSFVGTALCRPSAAAHALSGDAFSSSSSSSSSYIYDERRDVYYFGNAVQIGRLCSALDSTKGGEVGWTPAFTERSSGAGAAVAAATNDNLPTAVHFLESAAVSSHLISEGDRVVLHVASLWQEMGDERDNEDPSVAMAALNDAYVKKMSLILAQNSSRGRGTGDGGMKGKRGWGKHGKHGGEDGEGGGGSSAGGSGTKSADATAIVRTVTLLHIRLMRNEESGNKNGGGNARDATAAPIPLDLIRRIVVDEKGAVVSGHGNMIVAAFNLLSAGGHHQMRAANTVARLRRALHEEAKCPFVCSIAAGKVNALIYEGMVMCSGAAVDQGCNLLERARVMYLRAAAAMLATTSTSSLTKNGLIPTISRGASTVGDFTFAGILNNDSGGLVGKYSHLSGEDAMNGLCLLFTNGELSSTFECEAVAVAGGGGAELSALLPPVSSSVNAVATRYYTSDSGSEEVRGTSPRSVAAPLLVSSFSAVPATSGHVASKSRIVYRLAHRKAGKGGDDEWMYRLKDEEDQSPFAAVNAVFSSFAAGDLDAGRRVWEQRVLPAISSGAAFVSIYARQSIEETLSRRTAQ